MYGRILDFSMPRVMYVSCMYGGLLHMYNGSIYSSKRFRGHFERDQARTIGMRTEIHINNIIKSRESLDEKTIGKENAKQ